MKNISIIISSIFTLILTGSTVFGQSQNIKLKPEVKAQNQTIQQTDHKLEAEGLRFWQNKLKQNNYTKRAESSKVNNFVQPHLKNLKNHVEINQLKKQIPGLSLIHCEDQSSVIYMNAPQLSEIAFESKSANTAQLYQASIDFLEKNKAVLKLKSGQTFETATLNIDKKGNAHLRLNQTINGLPVYASNVVLHFNGQKLTTFNGRYTPTLNQEFPSAKPKLKEKEAVDLAIAEVNKTSQVQEISPIMANTLKIEQAQTTLMYREFEGKLKLVYKVDLLANVHEHFHYFIEAHSAEILDYYNTTCGMAGWNSLKTKAKNTHHKCSHDHGNLAVNGPTVADATDLNGVTRRINTYELNGTYYMIDGSRPMFDSFNSDLPSDPRGAIVTLDQRNAVDGDIFFIDAGNNNWNNHRTEVSAHFNAGSAYEYFLNKFNRNSIDGNGGSMFSVINVPGPDGESMDNASWNGYYISYGNGQEFNPLAAALDVAAHEMSHGVIQNTANLIYQFQPGALNESFADIFGAMVDRDDWKMGEDIVPSSLVPSGTLRDLANPNNGGRRGDFYWQPAHMNEYLNLTADQDNGGVHINSGIVNRAYYNFATAIGKDKAEQVYYHALTNYLTQNSQFIDCRLAVERSAQDLYGTNEINAARQAFDQVGILGNGGSIPDGNDTTPEDELPQGQGVEHMLVHDVDGEGVGTLFDFNFNSGQFLQVANRLTYPKADHVENGSLSIYVSEDNNIYIAELDANSPVATEEALTDSGNWRKAILSPDGSLIAALTADLDNTIVVFDPEGNGRQFTLTNPSTASDGSTANAPEYADAIEFDHSGENILYDAFNVVSSTLGNPIDYWDIGLLEVWNNSSNSFAEGDIRKVFAPQPTNISIGNASYANNTSSVITLDFLDSDDSVIRVLAANLVNGEVNAIAETSGLAGFPSYSPADDQIAYTDVENNESVIKVVPMSERINPTAEPQVIITGGKWPVWYIQGTRTFQAPLAQFESNITEGPASLTVNYFDQSTNSATEWSWTFEGGNPSSSEAQNPVVTYENEGRFNVALAVSNPAGSDTEIKSDYIFVNGSVGIEELGISELNIYPNPASDIIYINGAADISKELQISLIDMNGKLLDQRKLNSNNLNLAWDVEKYPAGTYELLFYSEDKTHVERFIKQ